MPDSPPPGDDETPVPSQDPAPRPPADNPHQASSIGPGHAADHTAGSGASSLERFLWYHPGASFFGYLADLQGEGQTPQERAASLRAKDPRFYWFCVLFDYFLVAVAGMATLAVALFLIWVTVIQPHLR